jgi:hypothetical protein
MFRKILMVIAATTSLGAAALTPTTASAGWHGHRHGHWHGHHGWRHHGWRHHGWRHHGWGWRHHGWGWRHHGWGRSCHWAQRPVLTVVGPQLGWVRVCHYRY